MTKTQKNKHGIPVVQNYKQMGEVLKQKANRLITQQTTRVQSKSDYEHFGRFATLVGMEGDHIVHTMIPFEPDELKRELKCGFTVLEVWEKRA